MNLPDSASIPQDPRLPRRPVEPRSRRRKRGQLLIPRDAEGRATLLASLSRRSYPTYELFIYAAFCGAVVGLGYVLDSQALLLFGVLIAPLLLPWVGLLLAAVTGSVRFFFEALMALLVSAAIVFIIGLVAGIAARPFMPHTFNEAFLHSRLWWPDLLVLALGAVILTASFVRSEAKPFLPSVMLAYELFLPLGAGGFGLGTGVGDLWPHGLLVFIVHFAWACMFGLFTLVALRFMPTSAAAFLFSAAVAFVLLAILVVLMSAGNWTPTFASQGALSAQAPAATTGLPPPTPVPATAAPSATPRVETPTASEGSPSPPIPASTHNTAAAPQPSATALLIAATPIYARVNAPKGGGAVLRETPGGKPLTTLDNFTVVELLPDRQDLTGSRWARVVAIQNGNRRQGWVVLLYLETVDPVPGSGPTAAATATPTQ